MKRRRHFLALGSSVLVCAVGGCLDENTEGRDPTSDNETDTQNNTKDDDNDAPTSDNETDIQNKTEDADNDDPNIPKEAPDYRIETLTGKQDEGLINHSAQIINGGLSDPSSPLTVEIQFTNTINEKIRFGEARSVQFYGAQSEDGTFLLKPGTHPQAKNSDNGYEFQEHCWKATERNTGVVGNGDWQVVNLEPDETVTQSLLLLIQNDEECPSTWPEEITFSTGIEVKRSSEDWDSEEIEQYDWGIRLTQN